MFEMDTKLASYNTTVRPVDGSDSPDSRSENHGSGKQETNDQEDHIRTIGGGSRGRRYGATDKLDRYLSSKPIISFGLTL